MLYHDLVNNICKDAIATFGKTLLSGHKDYQHFDVICDDLLKEYLVNDVRKSEAFVGVFNKLQEGPALYWIEVISSTSKDEILHAIRNYKSLEERRNAPAVKKRVADSAILYVGKVKGHFWGRLVQHMGFNRSPNTQGLQLAHWGRNMKLKVKFHVLTFEEDMAPYMSILELALAKELKPMLGKHR